MRLYFLQKLPSLFWWRAKVVKLNPASCTVSLPYGWSTQNPFRSIYFAAQCGVAEFSTGILALLALKDQPSVSMLVTEVRSVFTKKADGTTYFTCDQGEEIRALIQKAIQTGAPQSITMISTGSMADGVVVSKTEITWSFKLRASK